ncbi:hypothetical protein ROR02_00510 [Pararhodospirillum oryzae]|uniref:Uncharacterized protein n=2 Tax=Pararhodospirillum oryzae TaxID=478448 RepID=A0A512H3E4_9PROT|nr:hypothetical protein ROR02_00510 [Pararhodospirillum oryzae]
MRVPGVLALILWVGIGPLGAAPPDGQEPDALNPDDLEITVTNATPLDLIEVRVAPVGSGAWGDNLLEGSLLPGAGTEAPVVIKGGAPVCDYDVRGVFEDQSAQEEHALDLCDLGGYTFE